MYRQYLVSNLNWDIISVMSSLHHYLYLRNLTNLLSDFCCSLVFLFPWQPDKASFLIFDFHGNTSSDFDTDVLSSSLVLIILIWLSKLDSFVFLFLEKKNWSSVNVVFIDFD